MTSSDFADLVDILEAKDLFELADRLGFGKEAYSYLRRALRSVTDVAMRGNIQANPFNRESEKELYYHFALLARR